MASPNPEDIPMQTDKGNVEGAPTKLFTLKK